MSCCGQCGGENHEQTEDQMKEKNEDQTTALAQSPVAEKSDKH
ncbi:hypothetical protein [Thalassotalea profundi]|uniref:Uncharacterized protein n=1 Tax=Thalassotalea profundi TaxID=2036687 RepID=A0ABQ3IG15_9GAMM|nr:hypothetical protein [Thalassotalea profundi]GHE79026.1 hypothetical protein GCM10011501_03690 [Thalassotalea profundi]